MKLARVPLWGKPGGFVQVDVEATKGATIGTNLYWPDGTLVTSEDFGGSTAAPGIGETRTSWSLVLHIPANVSAVAALTGSGYVRRDGSGNWSASDSALAARIALRV